MPVAAWRYARTAAAVALALSAAPAAQAGWREDIGTFRIGIVAPGGGPVIEGADLMMQAFSAALGMPVEIFAARDYAALIDAQASKRIEYAIYSALAYATARRLCECVEPVVSPASLSGAGGVQAVVLKRTWVEGAGPPTIAVPPDSALFPGVVLEMARGSLQGGARYEIRAADTMEEAEALFADGKVNALLGWAEAGSDGEPGGTVARIAARGITPSSYEIAWRSETLRFGPHAVRTDIDAQAVALLRNWLLGLKQAKPDVFEVLSPQLTGGFISAAVGDYGFAERMIANLAGRSAGQ